MLVSTTVTKVAFLKEMEANQITRLRRQLGEVRQLLAETQTPDPEVQLLEQNILGLLQGYRLRMVELGAAGRLLVSGEIEDVLPLEDGAAQCGQLCHGRWTGPVKCDEGTGAA